MAFVDLEKAFALIGYLGKWFGEISGYVDEWIVSLMKTGLKVSLREIKMKPNVKLECIPRFGHLGDTLGAGGVEEAARASLRCACG